MEKLTQKQKLLNLLSDFEPHNTIEICQKVYGAGHLGLSRVGARIWDIKADGHEIIGWKDKNNQAIYWYQMVKRKQPVIEIKQPEPQQGQLFKPRSLFI